MRTDLPASEGAAGDSADLTFLNPEDDTPENRAIVELVEGRGDVEDGIDLDQVIREFGLKPVDFLSSS